MKRIDDLFAFVFVVLIAGCHDTAKEVKDTSDVGTQREESSPSPTKEVPVVTANKPAVTEKPATGGPTALKGTVVETMDAGRYTYIQVDTGKATHWAAAPKFSVKKGDQVSIPDGMPMRNFHSSTLNRSFGLIYFVGKVQVDGSEQTPSVEAKKLPTGQPPIPGAGKPEGGMSVEEVFAGKKDLEGKEVLLRGKVVKFNAKILGKNWLHLRDGTGTEGSNDLTVTTNAQVKVGDTVLVRGVVSLDRDFGAGYKYDVLVENAVVTVE